MKEKTLGQKIVSFIIFFLLYSLITFLFFSLTGFGSSLGLEEIIYFPTVFVELTIIAFIIKSFTKTKTYKFKDLLIAFGILSLPKIYTLYLILTGPNELNITSTFVLTKSSRLEQELGRYLIYIYQSIFVYVYYYYFHYAIGLSFSVDTKEKKSKSTDEDRKEVDIKNNIQTEKSLLEKAIEDEKNESIENKESYVVDESKEVKKPSKIGIHLIVTVLIVTGVIGAISFWYYWFEWRVSNIRKYCNSRSLENFYSIEYVDLEYKTCLREHGIELE